MEEVKVGYGTKLKSFLIQCTRVWHVLRKPTKDEYNAIAKVSALGIGIIGLLGFVLADILKLGSRFFG